MSRKKQRIRYELNSGDIKFLTDEEIKTILRVADELIATGGRSMLAKILKGSKDKKVLGGKEQALEIKEELFSKYAKRTAFKDELTRVQAA